MTGTSANAIFTIVRGVPKVPQDALSAELGLDSIDMLDANGFMVDTYDQQFANLKSNAVWAESPISDGRTLMTNARGNLTETVRVNLTAATLLQMSAMLTKLGKFRGYINSFWAGGTQDSEEPVYLKHQIEGEPGPRYALLFNMDIHVETPNDPGSPNRELTLSIEREPYWRGLAPGDNPKRWTTENVFGQKWDTSKAALYQGNDHLVFQQIDNCQEFFNATTFQSRNFVDIPAASLPGDAPPLVCIAITPTNQSAKHFIGVSTNRPTITDRNGIALPLFNSIPMSSGTISSGTAAFTTDAARGIAHVPTSALKRTVVVTPAGATEVTVLTWNVTNFPHFSQLVLRGKYALFLRASQIGGTAGVIAARITFGTSGGSAYDTGLQPVGDDAATGSEINYMGTFEFPLNADGSVSVDGKGYTAELDINTITLSVMRASGAGTIRLIDMYWLPLGNYTYINHDITSSLLITDIYDDTGYFAHGKPDPIVTGRRFASAADLVFPAEAGGQLQLTPGVNNRLYFVEYKSAVGAETDLDMTVRINIIPRWLGFRDA